MTFVKALINTRKKIKALQKEQDKIYKETLRALKIRAIDPESGILWDYLFNDMGTAKETLFRCTESVQ